MLNLCSCCLLEHICLELCVLHSWHNCRDGYAQVILCFVNSATESHQQTAYLVDWQHCTCGLAYLARYTLLTVACSVRGSSTLYAISP